MRYNTTRDEWTTAPTNGSRRTRTHSMTTLSSYYKSRRMDSFEPYGKEVGCWFEEVRTMVASSLHLCFSRIRGTGNPREHYAGAADQRRDVQDCEPAIQGAAQATDEGSEVHLPALCPMHHPELQEEGRRVAESLWPSCTKRGLLALSPATWMRSSCWINSGGNQNLSTRFSRSDRVRRVQTALQDACFRSRASPTAGCQRGGQVRSLSSPSCSSAISNFFDTLIGGSLHT